MILWTKFHVHVEDAILWAKLHPPQFHFAVHEHPKVGQAVRLGIQNGRIRHACNGAEPSRQDARIRLAH